MTKYSAPVCRGAFIFGSACGQCQRCRDEWPQLTLADRVRWIAGHPDQPPPGEPIRLHRLKCDMPYFEDVLVGDKRFEARRGDRDFKVDDLLQLIEQDAHGRPTGRQLVARVDYILTGGRYGIEAGYVVLGIAGAAPLER